MRKVKEEQIGKKFIKSKKSRMYVRKRICQKKSAPVRSIRTGTRNCVIKNKSTMFDISRTVQR
jgi:hypothetical protein